MLNGAQDSVQVGHDYYLTSKIFVHKAFNKKNKIHINIKIICIHDIILIGRGEFKI